VRFSDCVLQISALEKNAQLVRQLYRILNDAKYISSTYHGFVRSTVAVDITPAESIYQQLVGLHPQHDDVNKLIRSVGCHMAACLVGDEDGLQIVFGDKETKNTLEAMYELGPRLRTATLSLGNFLLKALTNAIGDGKFRILEVGAGTGGTTRYIVNLLKEHGIPFEYVFTDVSLSLVAAGRKKFKNIDCMSFDIVDIEEQVKAEYQGAFRCIIATNCVHATRNLKVSLSHLQQMLREDGTSTLIEITKNMFCLDIVVGLFEGW
jgi:phospholipid N-methyltransferase